MNNRMGRRASRPHASMFGRMAARRKAPASYFGTWVLERTPTRFRFSLILPDGNIKFRKEGRA